MNAIATIRSAPGLEDYLERLELRLEPAVASHPGLVAEVGNGDARRGRQAPTAGAHLPRLAARAARRGRDRGGRFVGRARAHGYARPRRHARRRGPAPRSADGLGGLRRRSREGGRRLSLRAGVRRAGRGWRMPAPCASWLTRVWRWLAAKLCRGARRSGPIRRWRTTCERCSLKTGKLFEAACVLGGGPPELGEFGLALGIAFQIADDILDCAGEFDSTGKAPGVDLRDGTPTLPLILAAREDPRRVGGAGRRSRGRRARAGRRRPGHRMLPRARARVVAACPRRARRGARPRGARGADLRRRGPGGVMSDPCTPGVGAGYIRPLQACEPERMS